MTVERKKRSDQPGTKCNVASKSWRWDHGDRCGTRPDRKYKNMASLFFWMLFGFWVVQVKGLWLSCGVVVSCCCVRWSSALAFEAAVSWLSLGCRSPGTGSVLFSSRAVGLVQSYCHLLLLSCCHCSLSLPLSQVNSAFLLAFGHVKILGHSLWG